MTSGKTITAAPRVTCYVDGFNLYHALEEHTTARAYRWLNLWSFAESQLLPGHSLERVIYFTSLPPWSNSKQARHERYIAALSSVKVETVLGRFQKDEAFCLATCQEMFYRYNEKLTDVHIATKMLEDAVRGNIDWAYLVSGDADQAPAIRVMRRIAPEVKSLVLFPPRRNSTELRDVANRHVNLGSKAFRHHLLPDRLTVRGRIIDKPANW